MLAQPITAGTDVDTEALLALRHVVAAFRRAGAERTAALPGPITTKRRGRGSEPDEIRPWTHGDDIRHIDRSTTARTGVPHVRTFRDEREQTTLLLADFRPSMLFGTRRAFRSVVAAEILALAGWRAVGLGARVALIAVGAFEPVFVRAATGDRAMTAVVGGFRRAHAAALAAGTAADPPLEDALSLAARSLPRGGSVVLATALDTPGPAFDDTAAALRRRIDLLVALVGDAFPRTAPAGAYPFLTAAGVRGVHVGGRPAGDAAAEGAAARLARLGARAVLFPAERPPEAQMLALESCMATAADPLAGLRPIRLPAEAPAPLLDLLALSVAAGILVALAILLAPRIAAALARRRSPRRRLAAALAAARALPPGERLAAHAAALRAYVAAVSGADAARGQGDAWLARLDEAFATTLFTAGPGRLYGETLYRPVEAADVGAAEATLSALAGGRRPRPC